jgi:D-alanine-D-alanine ligase
MPATIRSSSIGRPRKAAPLRLIAGPGGGFFTQRRDRPIDVGVAVVCCHGAAGEDGSLQAALDLAGVAYTGPSAASAALGMDKLAFGGVAGGAGLPVLPRVAVPAAPSDSWAPPFAGPYIVKPRFGGSSIGIATATDAAAVVAIVKAGVHMKSGAVVEPFRPDSQDIEIAVRRWPSVDLSSISQPERTGNDIYSYQQKYVGGEGMTSAPRKMDPELPNGCAETVRRTAEIVADLTMVRGVARVDFLLDGDRVYLNEINTIPGSLAKHLWLAVPFIDLLKGMIAEATARPTTHWTTAGADGSALRSAGTINAKLG